MNQFKSNPYEIGRRIIGTLCAVGLLCTLLTACVQGSLQVGTQSLQDPELMANLELAEAAMFLEEIEGIQNSGEPIHHTQIPMSVRTVTLVPGTYQISLVYEHLAQPKCWQDGETEHCWAVRDRGWWLPGATLIPGTIEWSPEAGKTYTVTRVEDYWSMTEKPSWNPNLRLAKVQ